MERINRLLTWPLLLLVLVLVLPPAVAAAAPNIPTPDTDVTGWLKALYTGVTSKAWGSVCGLVMIGMTYPLRRWGGMLIPWFKTPFGGLTLGFLVSLAGTLGVALAAGVRPTPALVATALSGAASAAGIWEWLKTHIPKVQEAADKATEVPPAMTNFRNISMIFIALIGLAACIATPEQKTAIKTAVVDCAKADAPSLLALTAELGAAALASQLNLGEPDWGALVDKALARGLEVGGCAYHAIDHAFDKVAPQATARSFAAQPDKRAAALAKLRAGLGDVRFKLPDGAVVQ